ncbi:MAG: hypothetical protein EZS28_009545 [Streblomastix strix]|uniref:Uncharacterized protein n=1 Tax=Streblomastix strix TaxID=222440 RepID=A0A5J4WIW6_9EUKA|nr:MAG: hypothetical protein EZS28_009545 [Streblomastix strix]
MSVIITTRSLNCAAVDQNDQTFSTVLQSASLKNGVLLSTKDYKERANYSKDELIGSQVSPLSPDHVFKSDKHIFPSIQRFGFIFDYYDFEVNCQSETVFQDEPVAVLQLFVYDALIKATLGGDFGQSEGR